MKKYLLIILLFLSFTYFNVVKLTASTNTTLKLNRTTININNYTMRFEAEISDISNVSEHGFVFIKGECENLNIGLENIYIERFTEVKEDNTYAVNFIMPTYAMKDIITVKAYIITKTNEVIYSPHYITSYEKELNESIVSPPKPKYKEHGICFEAKAYTNDYLEYGMLISLGEIDNLDHNYVDKNPTTSDQFSVSKLDKFKTFRYTLTNIPVRGYYQKLTARSYVKYLDKENNIKYYYSDQITTSYHEVINKPILEDIKVYYNKEKKGLTFYTTTNCYLYNDNDILEFGIIVLNKDVDYLTVDTPSAYIEKYITIKQNSFYLTIINFPESVYNEIFSSTAYIKYLSKNGDVYYYYSPNVTKITYNEAYQKSIE